MRVTSFVIRTALVTGAFLVAPAAFAQSAPGTGKQQQTQILDDLICPAGTVRILDDTVKPGQDRQILDDTFKPGPARARGGPGVKPKQGSTVAIQDSSRNVRCQPAPVTPAPVKP